MPYRQSPADAICSDVHESRGITVAHNESLNYSLLHGIFYLNVDAVNDGSFLQSIFSLIKSLLLRTKGLHCSK